MKTPVGPGRYDVELYDDSRCVWGAMCAFDSQTPARMQGRQMRLLSMNPSCFVSLNLNTIRLSYYSSERLRQKNIQDHKRPRINHHSTEQEPCMPIQTNSINLRAKPLIG
ncbi:hypothetical protein FBUS_09066 [Fasciolopsis buskii]|uniref:Uncharacterized protein n=1 Tax=Fasciolopsis buskii TaxID=27845 RepID=A0A8E0RX90_9TREM|nr:hypothetical protein FBUS_09066 [Fasciolopsis buski]